MKIDWKFLTSISAAIVGVLVPVWLWQADFNSHSLSVRFISTVALQPDEATIIPNLKVSIDGIDIESPYLTTLELVNNGSKAIPSGAFESPLELIAVGESKIVRAKIDSAIPNDIKPVMSFNERSVNIQPLLLNPNDQIRLTIITSGKKPKFSPRARIAGIHEITFEETNNKKASWPVGVLFFLLSLTCFILYFIYIDFASDNKPVRITKLLSWFTTMALALAGGMTTAIANEIFDLKLIFGNHWIPIISFSITAWTISYLLRKHGWTQAPESPG